MTDEATYNRLPPLFHRELVVGVTVILRVEVWFVNVGLPHTFSFSFTGVRGLSFCFVLCRLLFIWKKVNRERNALWISNEASIMRDQYQAARVASLQPQGICTSNGKHQWGNSEM